jgi:hypothetical protein
MIVTSCLNYIAAARVWLSENYQNQCRKRTNKKKEPLGEAAQNAL